MGRGETRTRECCAKRKEGGSGSVFSAIQTKL